MREAALPFTAISLCLVAYCTGNLLAGSRAPDARPSPPRSSETPILPDPHRLAGIAAQQIERLPGALWQMPPTSPQPGPSSLVDPNAPAMAAALPAPSMAPAPAGAQSPAGQTNPAEAATIRAGINQNLAAIVRSNGTYRLVLADRATTVRRNLAIGDIYSDGWRISRIAGDGVTLVKAGERLEVPVAHAPGPRRLLADNGTSSSQPGTSSPVGLAQTTPSQTTRGTPAPRRRLSRRDAALTQE